MDPHTWAAHPRQQPSQTQIPRHLKIVFWIGTGQWMLSIWWLMRYRYSGFPISSWTPCYVTSDSCFNEQSSKSNNNTLKIKMTTPTIPIFIKIKQQWWLIVVVDPYLSKLQLLWGIWWWLHISALLGGGYTRVFLSLTLMAVHWTIIG